MKKQGNWYMWFVGDAHIDACMACVKNSLNTTKEQSMAVLGSSV